MAAVVAVVLHRRHVAACVRLRRRDVVAHVVLRREVVLRRLHDGRVLRVLWRLVREGPAAPALADDDGHHVGEPDDAGDDAVGDGAVARVVGEQEAEAAVDDAEGDDEAAKPDVAVRPEGARLVLVVHLVVEHAQDRLEEDEHEEHDADHRVVFVQL